MQREEMGIVNGNPIVGEWEWEWEWLYGNGREWESERHSRTPLACIKVGSGWGKITRKPGCKQVCLSIRDLEKTFLVKGTCFIVILAGNF